MSPKGAAERGVIAIVGPCASGKTTLVQGLSAQGYRARQIVQEHSYVPEMWKILTDPVLLIYLDASFETCQSRKPLSWHQVDYEEQLNRLRHAREHCDLYLETDDLTPEQVLERVLAKLQESA